MQRVLTFGDDEVARQRFIFAYQGFLVGGAVQQSKSRAVVKQEAAILRQFKAVSEAIANPSDQDKAHVPNGAEPRVLKAGGGQMILDQLDYELLQKRVEDEKIAWMPWISDKVADMQDFVGAAPEHKDDSAAGRG